MSNWQEFCTDYLVYLERKKSSRIFRQFPNKSEKVCLWSQAEICESATVFSNLTVECWQLQFGKKNLLNSLYWKNFVKVRRFRYLTVDYIVEFDKKKWNRLNLKKFVKMWRFSANWLLKTSIWRENFLEQPLMEEIC